MNIFDVNWLAVVLAALAGFVVGGIWYGPVMGKKWMGAVGLTEEQVRSGNMGLIYGGAFAFSLVASWTLAHTFATYATDLSISVKVLTAFGVALGFIVGVFGSGTVGSFQLDVGLGTLNLSLLLYVMVLGAAGVWMQSVILQTTRTALLRMPIYMLLANTTLLVALKLPAAFL